MLPLDVQTKECEGFLSRARAHLTELDAKRATVSANIQDAERKLDAIKIQLQQSAPAPPPPDANSELRQLRETVAQLKGQLHLTKLAVTLECPSSKRQCRREDFIPNCVEELQAWIRRRQTDLQDAMAAGRPDEVARISDITCKAAQQWQRDAIGVMPSMGTNSVSLGQHTVCLESGSARRRIRALSRLEMPRGCRGRRWTAKTLFRGPLVARALRLTQRTIHQSEAADLLLYRVTVTTVRTSTCVAPPHQCC